VIATVVESEREEVKRDERTKTKERGFWVVILIVVVEAFIGGKLREEFLCRF
jgi:hypothetical protein